MATPPKTQFYPLPIQPPSSRIQVTRPSAAQPQSGLSGLLTSVISARGGQQQDSQQPDSQQPPTPSPDEGMPTAAFHQMLTQMWQRLNGKNLIVPCTATSPGAGQIVLAPMIQQSRGLDTPGTHPGYEDYATYAFTSPITTGASPNTIQVQGLGALNAYKQNGAALITTGDMVTDLQYFATFVDILNTGAGGFVIR